MPTILCLGIAVLDYVFAVDSMPLRAEKHRSEKLAVIGGGLAANAAVAVARLGGRARLATRLGADITGDAIVAGLESEGVDCALARRHAGRQSPVSSVFVDRAGERMVMSFADPAMPADASWLSPAVLDGVDAVHGDNRWEEGSAIVFRQASARGLPSLLDCDRAPKDMDLFALPSHIAFSEQGLREVSGEADPEAGLLRLAAGGLRNRLSVTLGERGVLWLDGVVARLIPAFCVETVDTLAAGDVWHGAFALALGERMPEPQAIRFASAAAAIKCTRFGGRAGAPTRAEVEAFLKERSVMATLSPGKLWGLRRMADSGGRFKMLAVDQRPPIMNPIKEKRGLAEAPYDEVAAFKLMLVEELQNDASAVLLDPIWALPRGLSLLSPARGLIVTLEAHDFTDTPGGRLSAEIRDWSVAKIKRVGGDAVKVLAWHRPDAEANVVAQQKDFTKRIGEACARYDIPFLFELLVYPLAGDPHQTKDYVEMQGKHADHVLQSVADFAAPEFGVDVFKLESPVPAKSIGDGTDGATQKLFDEMGRLAGRPWVMLSAGAGMAEFESVLRHAFAAGASGYLAGRAIWAKPFEAYPDWDAIRAGLRRESAPYMRRINALTDAKASPWFAHPLFGGKVEHGLGGEGFPAAYGNV